MLCLARVEARVRLGGPFPPLRRLTFGGWLARVFCAGSDERRCMLALVCSVSVDCSAWILFDAERRLRLMGLSTSPLSDVSVCCCEGISDTNLSTERGKWLGNNSAASASGGSTGVCTCSGGETLSNAFSSSSLNGNDLRSHGCTICNAIQHKSTVQCQRTTLIQIGTTLNRLLKQSQAFLLCCH